MVGIHLIVIRCDRRAGRATHCLPFVIIMAPLELHRTDVVLGLAPLDDYPW